MLLFSYFSFLHAINSGRMSKIPKETFCDTYNETNYYEIEFPKGATATEKGLLMGSSILINAVYFRKFGVNNEHYIIMLFMIPSETKKKRHVTLIIHLYTSRK